jgi:hypothetical protein
MGFQIEMGALEGWAGGSGKDSGSYIAVKTHPFPFYKNFNCPGLHTQHIDVQTTEVQKYWVAAYPNETSVAESGTGKFEATATDDRSFTEPCPCECIL